VLPETDDDSVRILTVHGAKGLEFPITVLAGMTTEMRNPATGPTVAFPPDGPPVVRIRADVQSEGYERWQPIDEQMDRHERLRLLYVAATRARDHLIVSLTRTTATKMTGATLLAGAGAGATAGGAVPLDIAATTIPTTEPTPPVPLIDRDSWVEERHAALASAGRRQVIAATTLAREAAEAAEADPGLAKRERNLELPPWNKGRYGTAVGRAVHGVLQIVDLLDGSGLAAAATAQAAAEGVPSRGDVVRQLAESALACEVTRAAAAGDHWREVYVAAPVGDRLVEGYIDLLYRSGPGLVVVDWKTDQVAGDDDVGAKVERYRLQGASYVAALEAATGESVGRMVFVFLAVDGATQVDLPDLAAAVAEVRERAGTGGLDDLVVATDPDT
jgi:ATP-dependent exoDNAse (exonuclease V) beta subunit